jgi:GTPase SAR1 family protein
LNEERQVSEQQGNLKAAEKRALYLETSALTGAGIDELFEKVV